jgi:hypothetical protein
MMLPRLLFSALLVAVLSVTAVTQAQQPVASTGDEKNAATRKKALALLETLAGQLATLQSAENRARIGSNIAGSLWSHDEQKARSLFAMVQEDLKGGLQLVDSKDQRDQHTFQVFLKLRADTIERIAKHDPEYALFFLKATKVVSEDPERDLSEETDLERALAQRLILKKPELALALARKTLEDGLSPETISIFRELYRKDKGLGASFHQDIVTKLKERDLFRDWHAQGIMRMLISANPPAMTDDSSFRDLISWIITGALNNDCAKKEMNNYTCRLLGPLMSHITRVDPSRASQLKHWGASDEVMEPFYGGTVELPPAEDIAETLRVAEQHPYLAGTVIQKAMTRASLNGDFELASKLANDFNGDPETKQYLRAQLESLRSWTVMNEETLAELQKAIVKLKLPLEQIQLLISVANRVGVSDRAAALKLLNQANALAESLRPGLEQARAQLGLARMYSLEKSSRGFEIVESLIPRLNDLVDAGVKLDGFDNRYLRDSEWTMSAEGGLGSLLTQLAQDAGYYAWLDFDRAVELSGRFARPEIRMMSQLKLAQGILAGPPQRPLHNLPARLDIFEGSYNH